VQFSVDGSSIDIVRGRERDIILAYNRDTDPIECFVYPLLAFVDLSNTIRHFGVAVCVDRDSSGSVQNIVKQPIRFGSAG